MQVEVESDVRIEFLAAGVLPVALDGAQLPLELPLTVLRVHVQHLGLKIILMTLTDNTDILQNHHSKSVTTKSITRAKEYCAIFGPYKFTT